MKKCFALILLAFCVVTACLIISRPNSITEEQLITKFISSIDSQDWDSYLALWSAEEQQNRVFFKDKAIQEAHKGIFNVLSVTLIESRFLPVDDCWFVPALDYYRDVYGEISIYLLEVDCTVFSDNKYYQNGRNNWLLIMGKEHGTWKIIETPLAPMYAITRVLGSLGRPPR